MNLNKIINIFLLILFIFQTVCFGTENNYAEENLNYNSKDENGNLKIYSEAVILMEASTGKVLFEKNMYEKKYPASTTKIMTAILALENCELEEMAKASESAVLTVKSGYSIADIQVGESFTVEELLNVMMLQSANEAATILAEHISGSLNEFTKLMNKKAKEIGCLNTNFVNANGAHDENHYSTAYDMALIARYCMRNPKFREIISKDECSLSTTDIWQEERNFKNTNSLMIESSRYYYPYCNGIKTGFTTPAKNCLISGANKDGFELISVILHAESTEEGLSARYLDTINLFNYGYNNFQLENIQKEYNMVGAVNLIDDSKLAKSEENLNEKENIKESSNESVIKKENLLVSKIFLNKNIIKIILGLAIFIGMLYIKINNKSKRKIRRKHSYNNLYDFKFN